MTATVTGIDEREGGDPDDLDQREQDLLGGIGRGRDDVGGRARPSAVGLPRRSDGLALAGERRAEEAFFSR